MTGPTVKRPALLLYAAALGLAGLAVAALFWDRYYLADILLSCRISGYGALGFLALTLAARSVVRVAAWLGLQVTSAAGSSLARHSGRNAALLGLVHASIAIGVYLESDWLAVWQVTYLRSGAAAAVVLLLLFATSSQRFSALLGWQLHKPLHRLVYVAAALVLHHMLLSPFASRWWTLVLFASLAAVLLLRLTPPPRNPGRP